jgi:hypothetical protein
MTNNNNIIKLSNVRIMYSAIMEPKLFENSTTAVYNAKFILDKVKNAKDIQAINKLTDELLIGLKTTREKVKEQSGSKNLPLKDGDISDEEAFKNAFTLNSTSNHKPQAFLKDGVTKAIEANLFYRGCYVNSYIQLSAYDKPCFGVKAYLLGIQFFKDGEPLSGGINLTGMFDSVDDDGQDDIDLPF